MAIPVSPLAVPLPELPEVGGVTLATGAAGVRYRDRTDVLLAEFSPGTSVAGVLTTSRCPSAPVDWCRKALTAGRARALLVNSGNANAFTGQAGARAAKNTADAVAERLDCRSREVMLASTGVIGEVLPDAKVTAVLGELHANQRAGGFDHAARAIMTTDTFPKAATRTARIGEAEVTLVGIAKGSGMVAPDLATMLAFVFTDAKIPAPALQHMLAKGADRSFNRITVDSDTSTSDTLLAFATGTARHARIPAEGVGRILKPFADALHELLFDLAMAVVRDGEGAQKLIEVEVKGAVSAKSARRIASSIANSPLVKTAIAGEDANWGRIVMAVGKAGEPAERDLLSIAVGGTVIAARGAAVEGYDEAPVVAHMKGREIRIEVDLGLGRGSSTIWTCDLTHGYIDINGSYRS